MRASCDEVFESISAMVDGEATTQERLLAEEHLARCSSCRELVHRMGDLQQALVDMVDGEPAVPADFPARAARVAVERVARPSLLGRLLDGPSRTAEAVVKWARSPLFARLCPALGVAGFATTLVFSALLPLGTLFHYFGPFGSNSLRSWWGASAQGWRAVLPHYPEWTILEGRTSLLALLLSLLVAVTGLLLLRVPAMVRDVRRSTAADGLPPGAVARIAIGLLLLAPLAFLPLLFDYAIGSPTYHYHQVSMGTFLVVAGNIMATYAVVVVTVAVVVAWCRSARGVPTAVAFFTGAWLILVGVEEGRAAWLQWATEAGQSLRVYLAGWLADLPLTQTPTELVTSTVLTVLVVALCGGVLLGVVLAWPVGGASPRSEATGEPRKGGKP